MPAAGMLVVIACSVILVLLRVNPHLFVVDGSNLGGLCAIDGERYGLQYGKK